MISGKPCNHNCCCQISPVTKQTSQAVHHDSNGCKDYTSVCHIRQLQILRVSQCKSQVQHVILIIIRLWHNVILVLVLMHSSKQCFLVRIKIAHQQSAGNHQQPWCCTWLQVTENRTSTMTWQVEQAKEPSQAPTQEQTCCMRQSLCNKQH